MKLVKPVSITSLLKCHELGSKSSITEPATPTAVPLVTLKQKLSEHLFNFLEILYVLFYISIAHGGIGPFQSKQMLLPKILFITSLFNFMADRISGEEEVIMCNSSIGYSAKSLTVVVPFANSMGNLELSKS